jgi:carboxymethylenebutenolidase
MGEMVTFPSNGATCEGYLAKPAGGSGKGVVVFQEWWGLNDNIKGIADRFAAEGFVALAPDMYHGVLTNEPDEAGKLLMALNIEQAAKDAKGAVAYLKDLTGGPVGTVGFCMGGALALFAGCNSGKDVAAVVDFYGVHPAIQYDFAGLTAPVQGHWPEHDDWTVPNRPALDAALKERGVEYEPHDYPGTGHAFFNEDNPDHKPEESKTAWGRTIAFFRKHL